MRVYAAAYNAGLAFSTDGCATFSGVLTDTARQWTDITVSSDGMKIVATTGNINSFYNNYIYVSTDGGSSWVERGPSRNWVEVVGTSDGTKLMAATAHKDNGATLVCDSLYVSTNSGGTWSSAGGPGGQCWRALAATPDGSYVFGSYGQRLYRSTDWGSSWSEITGGTTYEYWSQAVSSDGRKLVTVPYNGQVVTGYDGTGGVSWTLRQTIQQWRTVATTATGNLIIAADSSQTTGQVYVSGNVS
jgi:hypothetical protein